MKTRFGIMVFVALLLTSPSFAQHGHGGRHDGGRYGHGGSLVSIVTSLPFGAVALGFGNEHYHYYHGTFYHPLRNGYAIVAPPMGIIVPTLPPGSVSIVIGSRNYFRFGEVFYLPLDKGYQTVATPESSDSVTSQSSASTYEKIEIEGKTYYKKSGKIYRANVSGKGEVVYEEVGKTMKQ